MTLAWIIALVLGIIALGFAFQSLRLKNLTFSLEQTITSLELQLSLKETALEEKKADFLFQTQQLQEQYTHQLRHLEEKYTHNLSMLKEEFRAQNKHQTEILLTQNKNLLNEDSKKLLEEIFTPLKEEVKHYSERLTQNETRLQTNLKNMFEYSQLVGKNADKLANILKGDKKIRGNFGEIQLKSVLQNSGLIEGEQYELQKHFQSEEGNRLIPDAIIHLDKNKDIIIDSKFSLPSDLDFENLTSQMASSLAINLKNRIDELAKKPYKDFSANTYDFVLLFIPYQHLLDLALEIDPNLYQYAYGKKIYLTTPQTLFMALKTIQITWIDIKRNENVQQAFEELGKFYDKFVGVLESFERIESAITGLNKAKDELANRLRDGNGNLNARFKKLQDLGVKHKKALQ